MGSCAGGLIHILDYNLKHTGFINTIQNWGVCQEFVQSQHPKGCCCLLWAPISSCILCQKNVSNIEAAKRALALPQWASCPGDCRGTEEMQGSQGSCRNSTTNGSKHSKYSRGRKNILHASKVENSQGSPSLCPPHRWDFGTFPSLRESGMVKEKG